MRSLFIILLMTLCVNAHSQFGEPIVIDINHTGSSEICLGDLNMDGLPDIVVASAFSVQSIDAYLNLGNGEFGDRITLLSNTQTMHYDIACADLDSDGDVDILTFVKDSLDFNAMTMSWLRNDAGTFSNPILIDDVIEAQVELLTVDLDNDGHIDIVMSDDFSIKVYLNDGEGNFSIPNIVTEASEHYAVEATDFDGDGYRDLMVSQEVLALYLNDQQGSFSEPSVIAISPGSDPFFLTSGDYDNDGDQDFASWSAVSKIHVFMNEGSGTFFFTQEVTADAFNSYSIHSTDIDNDGDIDLLTNFDQTNAVVWFANDGEGQFSEALYIYQQEDFIGLQAVTFSDLDVDGDVEVIWGAVNHGIFYHDNLSVVSSLSEIDLGAINYFNVFPNPVSSSMTIELSTFGQALDQASIIIFNMNGQWVMDEVSIDRKSSSYDLSELSAGQYIVELRSKGISVQRMRVIIE